MRDDDGVTLVEILVVLGIIALVAGLAAPQVFQYLGSSKSKAASIQLKNIQTALELYYLDTGAYPDSDLGLIALIEKPDTNKLWNGPYLRTKEALNDPWGNPYTYDLSDDGTQFSLLSFGRDGKEGGAGQDADVIQ